MAPELGSGTNQKPFCKLCPDWFNEYASREQIFMHWYDIEIHNKIWHNPRLGWFTAYLANVFLAKFQGPLHTLGIATGSYYQNIR